MRSQVTSAGTPRLRRIMGHATLAAMATLLTALAAASTLGASAAPAGANPIEDNWRAVIQMENQTPFQLRLLDTTTTEMTKLTNPPRSTIDPGDGAGSQIENSDAAFGHGLAQILTYGIYEHSDYVGMMLVADGIDCEGPISLLCFDYHRWNSYWTSPLTGSYADQVISIETQDGGNQHGYHTQFRLTVQRKPRSDHSANYRAAVTPPLGNLTGSPWGWTQYVNNHTPFTLTRVWNWNSQGTSYLNMPPEGIPGGAQLQYLYQNSQTGHGPQSFVVYNAFDPTTKAYEGSVVIEAQTNCEAVAKVDGIPASCITPKWSSNSFAAAIPQATLYAHSESDGIPPFSLVAQTLISGNPGPPPTPTPPTPPPVPKTDTALQLTSSNPSPAFGQHVTLAAKVSGDNGQGTTVPSGAIDFFDGKDKLGSRPLSGSGHSAEASLEVSSLAVGSHEISATYHGDDVYGSSLAKKTIQVDRAPAELTIVSSANPSPAGAPLTFAVSVKTGDGTTAEGQVLVTDYPDTANRFTVTLHDGKGSGSLPNALSPGLHQIGASWLRPKLPIEASGWLDQVIRGDQATTTAVTASNATPSWGERITFSAAVASGAGTPVTGGQVQFDLDNRPYGQPIAVVNGSATTKVAALNEPVGPHTVTAVYTPDVVPPTNILASSRGSLTVPVKTSPTFAVVYESENPARAGDTVSFHTSVFATDSLAIGTVAYSIDGKRLAGSYDLVDGQSTLVLGPEYSRPGHYTLTATYVPPDNRFAPSSKSVDMEVDVK